MKQTRYPLIRNAYQLLALTLPMLHTLSNSFSHVDSCSDSNTSSDIILQLYPFKPVPGRIHKKMDKGNI